MPYTPTSWVNGTTPANATNLNHLETQYSEATLSFQADLITGFVEAGFVATKDGVTANQLDVTSGSAYIQQSDFTKRLHSNTATTFTTSAISSTYHLYIQPDGTFYWNTANTPATGSLFIAQVTTDGSGNILAVTDARNLNPTLLPNLSGKLVLPPLKPVTADSIASLGGQASAGSFGAPVIVALAIRQHVTTTGAQVVLSFTCPADGVYRVSGSILLGNTSSVTVQFYAVTTDPDQGTAVNRVLAASGATNNPLLLNGVNAFSGPVELPCFPLMMVCQSGTTIHVDYDDPSGTPADFVTAIIERLA